MMPIDTSSREKCISAEIAYLVGKGYAMDRARAAAINICKGVEKNEAEIEVIRNTLTKRRCSC